MITIRGTSSANKLIGPPVDSFTLEIQPRDQTIESAEDVEWYDSDVGYHDQSAATVDKEGDVTLQENTQYAVEGGSFQNLTPTVASLTGTKLTRLADGIAKIRYNTPNLKKLATIQIVRSVGVATRQFTRYKDGSLFRHMTEQLEPYMAGKTLADTSMYTSYSVNGTWDLNPSFWLPHLDFSCFGVWNDSGGNQMGGVAITPRHIVFNQHYQPFVGVPPAAQRRIWFKSWLTGEIHQRWITNGYAGGPWDYSEGSQGDVYIDELDEPLPPEIPIAKFLPPRFKNYTRRVNASYLSGAGVPVLACDQFKRAHVGDWMYIAADGPTSLYAPTSSLRLPLYDTIITGDSSSPCFGVINGELVLLSTWRYGGGGQGAGYCGPTVRNKIITGLQALSSAYTLTDIDLSGFESYNAYIAHILAYPSLIGYWRLTEPPITYSATIATDEKGFRTGTYIGTMALATTDSPFAGSADKVPTFDGVDDYVSFPPLPSLPVWSVEAWIKRNGNQAPNCSVVSDVYNGSSLNFTITFATADAVQIGFHTRGIWYQTAPYSIPDATWTHVVGTYDGVTLLMYINGVSLYFVTPSALSESGNTELRIGRRWDLPDLFKGSLADVAVYNTPLTPTEVLSNYNQGIAA